MHVIKNIVNFEATKFTTLIFMILEMWKGEYNIFNLPHDYEINDHVRKSGWEQSLVVAAIIEEEILPF